MSERELMRVLLAEPPVAAEVAGPEAMHPIIDGSLTIEVAEREIIRVLVASGDPVQAPPPGGDGEGGERRP